MEIRYLGFDQSQNSRTYQFDVHDKGQPRRHITITADMDIFRFHGIGIQDGPRLSGNKLIADLEKGWEGKHELTGDDVCAYVTAKSLAGAKRAETRKNPQRRSQPLEAPQTPWRNSGM